VCAFYLHLVNGGVIVRGIHLAFFSATHMPAEGDRLIDAYKELFLDCRASFRCVPGLKIGVVHRARIEKLRGHLWRR